MKKCPECGEEYPDAAMFCKRDQKPLKTMDSPSGPGGSAFTSPEYEQGANGKGTANMVIGGIMLLIGVAILILYTIDKSSAHHRYYLPIVCIVFGALRLFKGVSGK